MEWIKKFLSLLGFRTRYKFYNEKSKTWDWED